MKIQTSDTVLVIAGKNKGTTGKVIAVDAANNRVVVEKVNVITKHIPKRADGQAGTKIQFEKPIDASNVKLVCPNCKKPARVGYIKLENGKKVRRCKKCNEGISNPRLAELKKK